MRYYIDDELYELVQNMFSSNKNRIKGNGITDSLLLRGLIYCKECGHTFGFRAQYQDTKKHGRVCRVYGNCNYWAKRKNQGVCTPHSVKYHEIEEAVVSELKNLCNKYIDSNSLEDSYKKESKLKLKCDKGSLDSLDYLDGKTMNEVNHSAMQGTIIAHTNGNVPNIILEIDEIK